MPGRPTQVAAPPVNLTNGHGSSQDPLLSLVEVIRGYPATVHADKDPLRSRPEDLNGQRWYLVCSDQVRDLDVGSWRQKGGPNRMLFPCMPMTVCWEISWAFHDSNGRETEWMMLQYNITRANGMFSICRIGKDPTREVGGPAPPGSFDNDGHGSNHYPFMGAVGNAFESDIFHRGDYLELLDLDTPLLSPANSE